MQDNYCDRHPNEVHRIFEKWGCLKCLSLKQTRAYVSFADFAALYELKYGQKPRTATEQDNTKKEEQAVL